MGGESIYGDSFEDEFHNELVHIKGALSMANSGPNSNGSQFFIVQARDTKHLNKHHTVFGQTYEGIDIVDAIANVKADRNDKPLMDVVILSVKIEEIK